MGNLTGDYVSKVLQNSAVATGDGSTLDILGRGALELRVGVTSGVFSGTIVPQVFADGTWHVLQMFNLSTGADVTSITAPGIYVAPAGGTLLKAEITVWTSGEMLVVGTAKTATVAVASNVGSGGGGGGGDVNLIEVGGASITLGQKANAASIPVTLSTEQDDFIPTIGAVADAAVTTDTTGTISGKLRGLVKWAYERMPTSLGQKANTASLPVVLSTEQDGTLQNIDSNIDGLLSHANNRYVGTSVTPTLSTSPAYISGDCIGGSSISFSLTSSANETNCLTLGDKNGATPDLLFLFLKSAPSGGTYTDNSAIVLSDTDVTNITGMANVLSSDWVVVGGKSFVAISGIGQYIQNATIRALIVATGGYAPVTTSQLVIHIGVKR